MRYRKEIITTAATLTCAIGIGFFMQKANSVPDAPPAYQVADLQNANAAVLDVEEIILTSAEFGESFVTPKAEEKVVLAAAQEIKTPVSEDLPQVDTPNQQGDMADQTVSIASFDTGDADAVDDDTLADLDVAECAIMANARPVAGAMVNLTLDAACLPNERVTVHHRGLLFHQTTDATGSFDITVPAMAQDATFIVAFTNGNGAVAQTAVEELVEYDRVALQWKGEAGFALHAREFGADYGEKGHVWSQKARDISYAITGEGGYMTLLGDKTVPDALMAEVYTYPANMGETADDLALSVEAEVAENNCGSEIEAQTLQTRSGNNITSRDLTLSVPDCDAAGNFLVLNNLFQDLKVASN